MLSVKHLRPTENAVAGPSLFPKKDTQAGYCRFHMVKILHLILRTVAQANGVSPRRVTIAALYRFSLSYHAY